MLFNFYINNFINKVDKHTFDILVYTDDSIIISESKNQLKNIFDEI